MKFNKVDNSKKRRDDLLLKKYPFCQYFFEHESKNLKDFEETFKNVLNSDLAQTLLNFELNRIKDDSVRLIAGSKADMPIFVFEDVALVLKVLMPDQSMSLDNKYFSSVPCHHLVGVASDTPLHIGVYEESDQKIADQFNPNLSLTFSENRILEKSQTFFIERGKHVIQFKNPSQKPVVFYVLQSQDYEPITWVYDNKTLKPWLPFSTKQKVSRMELVADFLGGYKEQGAEQLLEKIYDNPIHFVRWGAVKNLLKLNFAKGMELLEKAQDDSHPHVALAAQRTAENIKTKIQGEQNANY